MILTCRILDKMQKNPLWLLTLHGSHIGSTDKRQAMGIAEAVETCLGRLRNDNL